MSYLGINKIDKMYLGGTAIGKAYLGDDLVYSSASAIPVTATPTISYVESSTDVVITATGNGTVVLMIDGTVVSNPHTINKTSSVQNVIATATAQETGKEISETATLAISVPREELVDYIGSWHDGVKADSAGSSIVSDANWCMTPYYKVTPGHSITFSLGGTTTTTVSVLTEMPLEFTNINQRLDYWRMNTASRTITLKSGTNYVIMSIPLNKLDLSYIKDNTDNKYIYKGSNVS